MDPGLQIMIGIEKFQFNHAQTLYILELGLKNTLNENFNKIGKVSWENSMSFWRYQCFRPGRRMYMFTLPLPRSPIYGRSVKWRNGINKMGGNIQGKNFLGGNFRRGNFPGASLMGGNFPGGSFLESNFTYTQIYLQRTLVFTH